MISFGLRWRLAQSATSFGRQVAAGLLVTAIGSTLFPFGSRGPAAAPSEPKVAIRIEPAPASEPPARPLLQEARFETAPETRAAKPVATHKPKPTAAVLPPTRPHDTPEAAVPAETVAADPDPIWLANTRAALGLSVSTIDATKRLAFDGKDWATHAAVGAVTTLGQAMRFAP
jgi:hypothetical protein